jgi:hypothetical protein
MIHAEKKCHPLKMGEVDFSPNVNTAKGRHLVWQMIIHKRQGNHVSSKKIRCIAKAVGIVGNPLGNTVTLREAKRCFKAADEEYRQLKLQAPMKRKEFLWDRSQDEALTLAVQKRAKQALVHERQWDNAQRMKHLWGKQCAGAVTTVGVRQGEDYFEYDDQATIESLDYRKQLGSFPPYREYTPDDRTPIVGIGIFVSHGSG